MRHMERGYLKKPNILSTFLRNTSCDRGWLRLLVQIFFGTLIVTSFILILLMVIGNFGREERRPSRCNTVQCRIVCNDAPFYDKYEDDIINAASEAEINCENIALELNRPVFKYSTIPKYWLSRLRSNVHELSIIGGNVKEITPKAFLTPFSGNIRVLILTGIEINVWERQMLFGLINLNKLYIQDTTIHDIRTNVLTPVDDSLNLLDIKAYNHWDPTNVTGTARLLHLHVVDFSNNDFNTILGNQSFSKIKACKTLYLNSCKIASLGPGTFDSLLKIEVLYLNDNYIVSVPVGLFDRILPYSPRIALQDNFWYCDCNNEDIRRLIRKELLIVDPICYYPNAVSGMTFSDFEGYCSRDIVRDMVIPDQPVTARIQTCIRNVSRIMYMNGACPSNNNSDANSPAEIIAPFEEHRCLLNRMSDHEIKLNRFKRDNGSLTQKKYWIKPVFFAENNPYSMIELALSTFPGYGLLWYQSSCVKEVYCVNTIPHTLKIFNFDLDVHFTFCPFNLSNATVTSIECVSFDLTSLEQSFRSGPNYHEIVMYTIISLGCLMCGAVCVYILIQRNPSLLKGNKRVIFVKHRTVEALIMPPNLPIRNKLLTEANTLTRHVYEKQNIFVLPHKGDKVSSPNIARSISMRSSDSNDASYISAIQPTEEQLAEWRSNRFLKRFDSTSSSKGLPYANINQQSLPYYSFHSDESIYEVPKQY